MTLKSAAHLERVYCFLRTVRFNLPLGILSALAFRRFHNLFYWLMFYGLWEDELFFSSKDRDISKVRLLEVTPAILTGPAAPKHQEKLQERAAERLTPQEM